MKVGIIIESALIGFILLSGCVESSAPLDIKEAKCIQLCKDKINAGENLYSGPCLSDNSAWPYEDWVCDVAHSPREDADNLPENQCEAYRSGAASHFIEVTPECELIRAV